MRSGTIILLPVVALLSALTLPEAKSGIRTSLRALFSPVAWPAHRVGQALSRATVTPDESKLFSSELGNLSTDALIVQIQNLNAQLEDLKKLSHLYTQMGASLLQSSDLTSVTSGPTDQRQFLTISTAALVSPRAGSAVFHPLGFVGQVDSVGVGAARVMLTTDVMFKRTGRFVRYQARADGGIDIVPLGLDQPLVEGTGKGMVARQMAARDIRNVLKVGDIVELEDPAFTLPALRGMRLGVVTEIDLPPTDAEFAEIKISPTVDLLSIREVFVVRGS